MTDDVTLRQIQARQSEDKPGAEAMLLSFIRETFPHLAAHSVELRPSAVSLNSFNGYLTVEGGDRLFFKTHVEPDSVISEYYNSQLLAEAGYPIIRPRFASTEYGRQFLIYDLVAAPSVFDVAHALETDQPAPISLAELTAAQNAADDQLWEIYQNTLAQQTGTDAARAPIHQLLYHRLTGPRYKSFYGNQADPTNLVTRTYNKHWIINGRRYRSTLQDLINNQALIAPSQAGMSVIGHGDAHNGNVFYTTDGLVYFDPAFAGRHSPLFDLTKPLFHNVFASWMYHPVDHPQAQTLQVKETADSVTITFDESLPAVRQMFWESKTQRVLAPLIDALQRSNRLIPMGRATLKLALFCCPLLTMNLSDRSRFPEEVAWLGLAYALIMGSESDGGTRSLLDSTLDGIEGES